MNMQEQKDTIYVATIIDSYNYGTVLQALATNNILSEYGTPCFVNYKRPQWTTSGWIKSTISNSHYGFIVNLVRLFTQIPNRLLGEKIFHKSINHYLKLCSPKPFLTKEPGNLNNSASYCAGSDQTWNFEYNKGIDPVYYLENIPTNYFKFSLSSSFGRPEISANEASETFTRLRSFSYLSVRESSGSIILDQLGLPSTVLCDPVLMCSQNYWRKIAKSQNAKSQKSFSRDYVLIYQLNQRSDIINHALSIAEKKNLDVVLIGLDWKVFPKKGVRRVLYPTIEEWLSLFSQARLVLTDSFHGTCFSLIFNRPFISFAPPKYSVRIADLLREAKLQNNYVPTFPSDEVNIKDTDFETINWEEVNSFISSQQKNTKQYLDTVFEGKQND